MKTKISLATLSLLFIIACNSEGIKQNQELQSTKMILKASNNMYVTINADSTLLANESDAAKAVVLEKVDQGNGKWALKASNGKFISDDRGKNNILFANRAAIGEWEQFEIISTEGSKINLKSSAGKIVSADQGAGNLLLANRDQAGEWETFTVEPK
jgi:hypothetical protein